MTPESAEDRRSVERLLGQEAGAVEGFVDRYAARIYRLTRRPLDDPRDAEEVNRQSQGLWCLRRNVSSRSFSWGGICSSLS